MTRLAVPLRAHTLDSAAAGCSAVGGRVIEVFRLGIEISAWVNSSSPGQAHGPMPATRFSHVRDSSFALEPLWDIWPRVQDETTLPLCNLVFGVPTDGPWVAWIAQARERRRACDEHCAACPPYPADRYCRCLQ